MSFCEDANIRQQIIDLLYDRLFNPSKIFRSNQVLEIWYNLMEKNINYPNSGWIASPSLPTNTNFRIGAKNDIMLECCSNYYSSLGNVFNHCLTNGYTYLGHDVPIWYNSVEGNKRIMIVSQDPRRDIASNNLFLSSPFGLHCRDYRECNGEVMQTIVDEILKNGHSVYLTDFYKAFTLDPNKKDKKSIDLLSGFVGQFKDILDEEIRLYKPNLIICFGNDATNALLTKKVKVEYGTIQTYKASIKEYKVLSLPHISGANNARWTKILNGEPCIANNKAMYINEKISNTLKQVQ